MHINLLPPAVRLKIQFRGALRRWRWIWISAVSCAIAYCGIQIVDLMRIRALLVTLEDRCQPLRSMQAEMNQEQDQLSCVLAEKRSLERIPANDHLLELFGVIARAGQPVAGRFQLTRLGLVFAQPSGSMPAIPTPPPAPGVPAAPVRQASMLSLQGLADDDRVLASLVTNLRDSGVFERVDLKSSTQSPGAGVSGRSYQLDCRFEN
jgi:hypothetical protein